MSFKPGQCILRRVQRSEVLGILLFVFIGLNFLKEGALVDGKFQTISECDTPYIVLSQYRLTVAYPGLFIEKET